MNKISVVINTFNEEKNIEKAIKSIEWADEIVVCDMYSIDNTIKIAKNLGAKIIKYKRMDYVEPARNFAISKSTGDWILLLDADEEVPLNLSKKLREIVFKPTEFDYVEIPRKNIIFDNWMQASMWWPDYHTRFFRKGLVIWNNKIHSKPQTKGSGLTLPAEEDLAIIHQNYQSISQFIERMNRYSRIQAEELKKDNIQFNWKDLFTKPLNEFLSRFFANKGYMDGVHGLVLSLLQAFSFLVVYLKLWEMSGFNGHFLDILEVEREKEKAGKDIAHWFKESKLSKNPFKRFLQKIKD